MNRYNMKPSPTAALARSEHDLLNAWSIISSTEAKIKNVCLKLASAGHKLVLPTEMIGEAFTYRKSGSGIIISFKIMDLSHKDKPEHSIFLFIAPIYNISELNLAAAIMDQFKLAKSQYKPVDEDYARQLGQTTKSAPMLNASKESVEELLYNKESIFRHWGPMR